jgi:hypothetical protein
LEDNYFREEYVLHFGKKKSSISSRLLGESLIGISTAINEINSTLGTGKEITINVKPFEEGSFEVPFELVELAVFGALNLPNVSSIPGVIKILKEFIDIKINLKGFPPREVKKTNQGLSLTSQSGDVYNISRVTGDLVFNNVTINESFNRGLSQLQNDKELIEYSILDSKRKPIVTIKPKELAYFTPQEDVCSVIEQLESKKQKEVSATLRVHKVVFDTTSKWGFIYKGNKISAKITDANFHEKVQRGGRFGKGDILEVLMEIHQEFDEAVGVFINKSYIIAKVLNHMPKPEQIGLF